MSSNALALLSLSLRLFIGAVLVVAACAKATDYYGTTRAMRDFRLGNWSSILAVALPLLELSLGIALFSNLSHLASLLAGLLFATFAVLVTISVASGATHDCNCFGAWMPAKVSWGLVSRNVILCGIAIAAYLVPSASFQSAWTFAYNAIFAHAPAVTVLLVIASIGLQLGIGLLILRLGASRSGAVGSRPIDLGVLLPNISARCLDGAERTIHSIVSDGPVLLVFIGPTCTSCKALLEAASQQPLLLSKAKKVVIVSRGPVERNSWIQALLPSIRCVLLQQSTEVSRIFGVSSTPTAILLSSELRTASKVIVGPTPVFEFWSGLQLPGDAASTIVGKSPSESVARALASQE